ncbi:MAG TPA: EAL domain-containing protein [Acidimicrobiales bacterium]|nr:EAL domain-containing protein [Acidimicrobiales bacterium]
MALVEGYPHGDEKASSFRSRLRHRVLDPTVLAGPPVAVALCLFRLAGLIAALPYWAIVTLVLGAQAVSIVLAALWTEGARGWRQTAYVGGVMGVIGVVAYSTGWGPILSLGFIFGAAYVLQLSGSGAARPAMVWTVVYMGLGELAISLGIAPSLISRPLVHGLAGLGLMGVLLTITLLGRSNAARERVEGELRRSERRFKAIVRDSSDIIAVVDPGGTLRYVSPAFERILKISLEQLGTPKAVDLLHPDDRARIMTEVQGIDGDELDGWRTEIRLQHADGSWRWFEAVVTNRVEDPNVRGTVARLRDVSARRQAEEALRQAHERFRSAFENAPIGMAMTDLEGRIMSANPAMARIVGRSVDDLSGMSVHDLTHPDDRDASTAEMRRLVVNASDGYRIEKRYTHTDGHDVWVSVSVSCVRDEEGRGSYLIGQVEDVTERRALRERLAYAAIHDPLTSLPNRVLFMDRLETALSRAARHGRQVAVIFLDLDRFKLVNDGMGHAAGDRLLETVAQRLQRIMRPSDTVARFGGDEFVVMCDEISEAPVALRMAERLMEALSPAVSLAEGETFVTASLGLALSGDDRDTAASLLRDADTAMYVAKERGRARIEVFDPKSHALVLDKIRTRNELHGALDRGEFRVYYQPIVEMSTGRVACVEALLRWQHPERGLLHPGEFLSTAEESGLITPIGAWVLEESCRQAVAWTEERRRGGLGEGPISVSVNLSPRQLIEPNLVEEVAAVVAGTGIAPETVWLEITEGALAADTESTLAVLRRLRALGIRLAIDDFGTGYASLGHLKSFPVEVLKIDRSFMAGLGRGAEDATIVSSVISLAGSLGLDCVAEGIEQPYQLEELRTLGCAFVQGFLLGVPLPAAVLGEQLGDDLSPWTVDGSGLFDIAYA